ncbi:unnamed protein product [Macrosiphum euphorbiae]|uniref:Uncharacterized protein n=1 Tax=Macrosiphum euphorbiae TaxID=13131 RepID=A0AAV0XJ36_9HEMI|nr:unnamed protein product [Macrosiphum euphorbiae]
MDVRVIIYFLGIAVGAFAAEVEERPITFYKDLYYKGESRTMAVSVGTPEGSPCESCYNFIGDVANLLKFRRPGSIEVPPDHYIRLYENFNCHGHHMTFCGTACDCNSSHIDLSDNNQNCYVKNISRQFCPIDTVFYTMFENDDHSGLYSFSVHKRPEEGQILSLEYPGSVSGKCLSFEKCTANDILRRRSTTNELPTCSWEVKENNYMEGGGEYCFWRRWLVAMHYGNYLLQFTRTVNNNNDKIISNQLVTNWSFLAPYGNFFGVQPRYDDNYSNVLYAVLFKSITNSVPREHKEALRNCASNVFDYRREHFYGEKIRNFLKVLATKPRGQTLIEATRFNITDFRILVLWDMIKTALDVVIRNLEGGVSAMPESEAESFYLKVNGIIETLWRERYDKIFNAHTHNV